MLKALIMYKTFFMTNESISVKEARTGCAQTLLSATGMKMPTGHLQVNGLVPMDTCLERISKGVPWTIEREFGVNFLILFLSN